MKNLVKITLLAIIFSFSFALVTVAQSTVDDGYGEDISLFLEEDDLENESINDQIRLVVYPSPANGDQIQIKYDNLIAKSTLTVYDANGRTIRTESVGSERENNGTIKMSVSGLASGFYIVKLVSGHLESMQKILIH